MNPANVRSAFVLHQGACVLGAFALVAHMPSTSAQSTQPPAVAEAKPAGTGAREAKALVGWEYRPQGEGINVKPGLSCTDGGSAPITRRGKPVEGWSAQTLDCDDNVILALARESRLPDRGERRLQIVDAVLLPGATHSATLHHQPGLAFTGLDHNCKLDGRYNPNLVVTMRRVQREWLTWRNSLAAAWTYDLERGRIVPVPIKRVVCHQELDP